MTDLTIAPDQFESQSSAEQAARPAPQIVDQPCRHYDAGGLTWHDHPEFEAFMRATYEAHVARSCSWREFQPSVPQADLAEVTSGKYLRREAAPWATRMLDDARKALGQAQAAGDHEALATRAFGISSAYRSALRQYHLWNDRFPGYMAETESQRVLKPGGPLGHAAAQLLATWIGHWIAAPGFSNHNDGRAIDLFCTLSNQVLSANRKDIPRWCTTWLHQWLDANASRYHFYPYTREPWHWEYRERSTTALLAPPGRGESEAIESVPEGSGAEAARHASGPAEYWRNQLRFGLSGNTVEPLIDGPAAFRAMQEAIESADSRGHYIYMLAWWLDPWVNLTGPGTCLLDLFGRAVQRGVQVRVLVWDPPSLIFGEHAKLHDAAVGALNHLPNCFAQKDDARKLAKSHHQKLLVVNGRNGLVALCGGVDVNADRILDLPPPPGSYRADRPAVGWTGSSGSSGPAGSGKPLHDVHARLTGPTALPLLRVFLRRWWARSGDRAIDQHEPLRGTYSQSLPPPTGHQFVRIGETFNGVLQVQERKVHSRQVTVQDIWLRSILGARRFIYMEEQYLISDCAAAAIRAVLPRLSHVTILIPPSEITDVPGVWARRRAFMRSITEGNPDASKLHIYTRAARSTDACVRVNAPHLYVHAKMAVIDDELMLIGSANCNNRGWETDSELVTASFEDAGGTASTAGRLRAALWAHHLGVTASATADPVRSRGLWDTASSRHVCRYDPDGGHDSLTSYRPDWLADPSDRESGDPCLSLLAADTHR